MKQWACTMVVAVSLLQSAVLLYIHITDKPACLTCAVWDGVHQAEREAAWVEFQKHVIPVKREKKHGEE